MSRRLLSVLALALLLTTAGCLGSTAPTVGGAATDGDPAGPAVSVSASGTVSVDPDVAVVRLAAERTADSAEEARSLVAADVAAVREALAALGVEDDAVTTAYFRIDPQYDHTRESREVVGYRAVHALTVEADVDQAGAVIDAAVGAGAVRVDGVQFTLADETRQAAREQALGRAMANAAGDAGAIAEAADLTLDGVRSVSTGSPTFYPYDGRVVMAEAGAGDATSIQSGPVTVVASVQVTYAVS